jgi:hypothetical protein
MIENTTPPTAEEIAQARENAFNANHSASWVWDETAVSYVAPSAPPSDGYPYLWDETTTSWVPFPDYLRG